MDSQQWLTLAVALLGFAATIGAQIVGTFQRRSDRKQARWAEWRQIKVEEHLRFLARADELHRVWERAWLAGGVALYGAAYGTSPDHVFPSDALARIEMFGSAETIPRARRLTDWFALALVTLADGLGPGDPDNPVDPADARAAENEAFGELRAAYVAAVRKELLIDEDWSAPLVPWTEG